MGYVADYFAGRVGSWIESGWLPRSGNVADFGAQEFQGDQAEAKRQTGEFLRSYGIDEARIEEVCSPSRPLSVASVYRAMGFDYAAIDVQDAEGVRLFDLNTDAPPLEWRATFDLVNNEGAIEHLTNPINGFQVAHELLKVGGVAVHSIPLAGHTNHGLMHPTIKFYNRLVGANDYELLLAEISIGQSQPHAADQRFVLRDRNGLPIARRVDFINAWLHFAYRKTDPAEFRAPFAHWNSDDSGELDDRVSRNVAAYARNRLTENGRRDLIGDEYERQLELQRREHEYRSELQLSGFVQAEQLADRNRENRRKLQAERHQRDDTITNDLQRGERERTDALLAGLRRPGITGAVVFSIFAIAVASVLNGAALLISLSHGTASASWPFAAGLVSAFLPTMAISSGLSGGPEPRAKLAQYGSRALWLLSIVLFVVGCLTAGQR
jgi:SAM-dependent methyltransferase